MSSDQSRGMTEAMGRMLATLSGKVDTSHTALVVVDVVKDFCAEGGYLHRERGNLRLIHDMLPRLIRFIEKARAAGVPIIYVQPAYSTENNWYLSDVRLEQAMRKRKTRALIDFPVCTPGSWGASFCDGIEPLPEEVIVNKHRYSGFIGTDLDLILRSKRIRTLIMCGTTSNGCVYATAADGFMRDYYIVFLADCSATFDDRLHRDALEKIDLLFGEVVNAADVVACWEGTDVNV
ncbi:cysteine hydrolase family protein [Chloroflexota bacterium]